MAVIQKIVIHFTMLLSQIVKYWRTVITIIAPCLLCPLVFYIQTSEAKGNKSNIRWKISISY